TSATPATWIWPSRSAPASSRTARCTCRRPRASSPTRCPRRSGKRPRRRRARCCARPSSSRRASDMLLMIDNYDSFTYNLVQYFGELREDLPGFRTAAITLEGIHELQPARLVLSPGPCTPAEAGICVSAIQHFAGKLPILGVCLGHQSIGAALGGRIVRAQRLMHGKTSVITTDERGVYAGLPREFTVIRYHSLAIERASLPEWLEITSTSEDGEIMGVRHKELAIEGVQFHPESILTEHGHAMLKNFLARA